MPITSYCLIIILSSAKRWRWLSYTRSGNTLNMCIYLYAPMVAMVMETATMDALRAWVAPHMQASPEESALRIRWRQMQLSPRSLSLLPSSNPSFFWCGSVAANQIGIAWYISLGHTVPGDLRATRFSWVTLLVL